MSDTVAENAADNPSEDRGPRGDDPSEPRRGRIASWLGRLALLVVSLAVGLLLVEGILRLIDYEYQPFAIPAIRIGSEPLTLALENEAFGFDRRLLWKPVPGHGVFNTSGWRGDDPAPDDPRFRILVIGDSNTLGWMRGSGANWPMYLGQNLGAEQVALMNASAWGWSSFQGLRRLEGMAAAQPDLIVFSFGANDGHRRGATDRRFADRLATFERFGWWRASGLTLAALDIVDRFRPKGPRVPLERFEANLRDVARWAREHGATLALSTRPFRETSTNKANWAFYVRSYNDVMRRLSAELELPLIDHAQWSEGHCHLFTDRSHYNEHGHRAAAIVAYQALRPYLPMPALGEGRWLEIARSPDWRGLHIENAFPRWTDGDVTFERLALRVQPGDRLAIDAYGWHPWRHEPERLALEIEADGRGLERCRSWPKRHLFELPADLEVIETLRITTSTFVPSELLGSDDHRRLGLDIRRISLLPAAEAPCG